MRVITVKHELLYPDVLHSRKYFRVYNAEGKNVRCMFSEFWHYMKNI